MQQNQRNNDRHHQVEREEDAIDDERQVAPLVDHRLAVRLRWSSRGRASRDHFQVLTNLVQHLQPVSIPQVTQCSRDLQQNGLFVTTLCVLSGHTLTDHLTNSPRPVLSRERVCKQYFLLDHPHPCPIQLQRHITYPIHTLPPLPLPTPPNPAHTPTTAPPRPIPPHQTNPCPTCLTAAQPKPQPSPTQPNPTRPNPTHPTPNPPQPNPTRPDPTFSKAIVGLLGSGDGGCGGGPELGSSPSSSLMLTSRRSEFASDTTLRSAWNGEYTWPWRQTRRATRPRNIWNRNAERVSRGRIGKGTHLT